MMAPLVKAMAEQGSPWLFGTDEPGELAERHGWSATVTDIAKPGNGWTGGSHPRYPWMCPMCRAAISSRRPPAATRNKPRDFGYAASVTSARWRC